MGLVVYLALQVLLTYVKIWELMFQKDQSGDWAACCEKERQESALLMQM